MPADATADLVGGRYRLASLIGRGGMGEVWAGEDTRLHRQVAVKLLRRDRATDVRVRQRFEREAHLAAQVSHPNVVAIFDVGEHGGVPYIVMERLPGRTLADAIATGPLDESSARRLTTEVLEALRAAHAAGVLHRDIKPSNVLLTEDGNAKVGDFGIAKAIEPADVTASGELLGTPAYLAPERVQGSAATVAADIYSVGVVLYEMLTATKPFDAETPFAVLHAIANREVAPISAFRTNVHPDLVNAVTTAMSRDPSHRYQSAAAMLGAIDIDAAAHKTAPATTQSSLGSSPVPATERLDDVPWPQSPRVVKSRRRLGAFVAIAVTIIATFVAVTIISTRGDSGRPNRTPPTTVPVRNAIVSSTAATTTPAPSTTVAAPQKPEKKHGDGKGHEHGHD